MAIILSSIIVGKKLGNAIKAHGKASATFREREHLLAVSAIAHHAEHGGAEHIQSLYDMTPTNYRPALRKWACEFGRFTFKAEDKAFIFAKSKKGDLEAAMAISPAEFEKSGSTRTPSTEYDFVAPFTTFKARAEKLLEEFEAKNVPMNVVAIMEGLQAAMAKAETAAAKFRVVTAKDAPKIVAGTDTVAKSAPKPAKGKGKAAKSETVQPEAAAA